MTRRRGLGVVLAVGSLAAVLWWFDILPDPFQTRIPDDAFKLIPLHDVPSDTAVVFVHGLDGHPTETFTASGRVSWPDLIAGDDRVFPGTSPPPPVSTYASYAVDYRLLYKSNNTIQQAAEQIAELLRSSELFRKHNHVWFVTHSLGGLLMKRVILLYSGRNAQRLLTRIAGVFLFGVPSQGAPLANLDDNDVVAVLTTVFGRRYRVVRDLRPEEAAGFLQSLETSWGDFLRLRRAKGVQWPPYVHCAYEVDETLPFNHVVSALYAQTDGCFDGMSPMSRTHTTLVKPLARDDQVYGWTRDRLGRGRERLRTWALFEIKPGVEPLSALAADYQALHRRPPDEDGLLEVSENITYADPVSEQLAGRLRLIDKTYAGTTPADVFEAISKDNGCLSTVTSPDRREVVLRVAPPVTTCTGDGIVCAGVPCPPRPARGR